MDKENLQKIIISAPCENLEDEARLNQTVFAFNQLDNPNAVMGTKEINTGLPYLLEVLVEADSATAFIDYLADAAPEAEIK
ncbi:MAG TPA: hypothetical protein PLR62_00190 [Candidatus Woesebacteria bacterium]|jgi:hypothetical protein|nr:hypothetical protein [Candidatus Woesebacteria bacterium]HOC07368.1 hypothetical protein [Candidatus Woesebacteria bacterium]HOI05366.1 hypothetical protein [Candidatus Woesebacteria bacterium]HPA61713.1 hypothetical protein [Candidatus Woesebacteria bacterium]HQL10806.1 hypothetical protein [Candidatus Woesebacteria bacterium]